MCAPGYIGFRFRCLSVSSFCLFVILASESSQKNEEELYLLCAPGYIGFRFRCLCVSSPSNFSAKVLRQKAAARRHKLTLQKSNTLIWTFLSLCKGLQSLCWSSGETKLLKKRRKLLRRHRPQTASASKNTVPFLRIYFETSICSDHILSHYISTLLAQQCIVGKFNSRCYPC